MYGMSRSHSWIELESDLFQVGDSEYESQ
jgi:hypothetical protein